MAQLILVLSTADNTGAWSLTLSSALSDGTYSFTANATDTAGNPGPASSVIEVTVDTIPPAAPAITDPEAGTRNTDITTITGTAENDATVQVFDGSTDLVLLLLIILVLGH